MIMIILLLLITHMQLITIIRLCFKVTRSRATGQAQGAFSPCAELFAADAADAAVSISYYYILYYTIL